MNGKPIIEWVISMFPGNHDFIFICRQEHLKSTPLESELKRIKPEGKIISIEGHKLGPVFAVTQVLDLIDDDEEVITNYCDFFQVWDFEHFAKTVREKQVAGAIPCYTGFHPHLLHPENLYASCKKDAESNLIEIREKYSFEVDKTKTSHSGGTYYFSKGKYVKKYFQQLIFYIHNNPVHHGFVKQMGLYPWSSFETVISDKPTKLKRKEVIELYGDKENFIFYHNQQQNFNEINDLIIEY